MGLLLSAAPVAAANWFELNFGLSGPRYDALVPLCDDRGVLSQISSKFGHKEGEFWNSNLEIVGIDRIREAAFRPGPAPRRPSRAASATASRASRTARATPMHYSILRNLRLARGRLGRRMVRGRARPQLGL